MSVGKKRKTVESHDSADEDEAVPSGEDEAVPSGEDEAVPSGEDEAGEDEVIPSGEDHLVPSGEDEAVAVDEDKAVPVDENEAIPAGEDKAVTAEEKEAESVRKTTTEWKAIESIIGASACPVLRVAVSGSLLFPLVQDGFSLDTLHQLRYLQALLKNQPVPPPGKKPSPSRLEQQQRAHQIADAVMFWCNVLERIAPLDSSSGWFACSTPKPPFPKPVPSRGRRGKRSYTPRSWDTAWEYLVTHQPLSEAVAWTARLVQLRAVLDDQLLLAPDSDDRLRGRCQLQSMDLRVGSFLVLCYRGLSESGTVGERYCLAQMGSDCFGQQDLDTLSVVPIVPTPTRYSLGYVPVVHVAWVYLRCVLDHGAEPCLSEEYCDLKLVFVRSSRYDFKSPAERFGTAGSFRLLYGVRSSFRNAAWFCSPVAMRALPPTVVNAVGKQVASNHSALPSCRLGIQMRANVPLDRVPSHKEIPLEGYPGRLWFPWSFEGNDEEEEKIKKKKKGHCHEMVDRSHFVYHPDEYHLLVMRIVKENTRHPLPPDLLQLVCAYTFYDAAAAATLFGAVGLKAFLPVQLVQKQ